MSLKAPNISQYAESPNTKNRFLDAVLLTVRRGLVSILISKGKKPTLQFIYLFILFFTYVQSVYGYNEPRWLVCSIIYEVNIGAPCWTKTFPFSDQLCLLLNELCTLGNPLGCIHTAHTPSKIDVKTNTPQQGCMHSNKHQLLDTHTALLCIYRLDLHETGYHLQKGTKEYRGLSRTLQTVKSRKKGGKCSSKRAAAS